MTTTAVAAHMRKLEAVEVARGPVTVGSTRRADDPASLQQPVSATAVEEPSERMRGATLAYVRAGGTSSLASSGERVV